MPHVTVADLVTKARSIAKQAMEQAIAWRAQDGYGDVVFADDIAGKVSGLADNIEALLNDYTENGQALTSPGTHQYVGDDGQLKQGDGTS